MNECFSLLKQLINIPSPSGEEGGVAVYIARVLSDFGFNIQQQQVAGERINIFAYADEPSIVLSTHMDTVTPFIPFSEDEEMIYGRGACDAKGPMAAQIMCAADLLKRGVRNVGLLFVAGEEYGSDGALAANNIPNKCKWLINGEPTDNRVAIGSKGALRFSLKCRGRSAHAAYPDEGESAILKLLDVLKDLIALDLPEALPFGITTLNIGTIRGGEHANVVPDEAAAELMYRLPVSPGELKVVLEEAIGNQAEIDYLFECDPVEMEAPEGFDTTVVSFATDIPLLNRWGKPLLFGPGSIRDAHSEHERISEQELSDAVSYYRRLVEKLNSSGNQADHA